MGSVCKVKVKRKEYDRLIEIAESRFRIIMPGGEALVDMDIQSLVLLSKMVPSSADTGEWIMGPIQVIIT